MSDAVEGESEIDALARALSHDHVGTEAMLEEARAAFEQLEHGLSPEAFQRLISEPLVALRDHLTEHFANEEELLEPIVGERFPDLAGELASLKDAHESICALVVRLGSWAESDTIPHDAAEIARQRALFDELARQHDQHGPTERAIFDRVIARVRASD
ncbi:MAG: hemerythrin domain-containing protein [Polyangiaceae bacterium]